jgi:isopenicillin-N N-acyltransferase-like protein
MNLEDSITRYQRMVECINAQHGGITHKYLMKCLTDHANYPKSICNHPDEKVPTYKHMKTISALIFQPKKQKMWATNGNPCEHEFVEYELSY